MKNKFSKLFLFFVVSIIFIILFISVYINIGFENVTFDQLLYSLKSAEGTSIFALDKGIMFVAFNYFSMIILLILIRNFLISKEYQEFKYIIKIKYKNKIYSYQCYPFKKKVKCFIIIILFLIVFYVIGQNLKVFDYIKLQLSSSKVFEDYYVNPEEVSIKSPDNKKNLIHIYVESLESSNVSKENGGAEITSYIPELEKIALDNTNFSNNDKIGGALNIDGVSWTVGALVAYTSGVPLKVPIYENSYSGYNNFLKGVYSLGEVLKDNGYKNYFMLGSKAKFGGRKTYFKTHGNYEIYDYNWAKKEKLIDKDYYEWWGYEDKKLYEFAKDKLLEISKCDEPFNFTMLTADTHFTDGYLDESCEDVFDSKYANVFHCSDKMLGEFISWIKEQDFYEDTVIIITGDHLTMQNSFYDDIDSNYTRTVYNAIINSDTETDKEKNREFTTMDMYPTTLASLGFTIKGDRLGLGTNLYSSKKTLVEDLGYKYFNEELKKNSKFYNKYLLGDDYYEMKNTLIDGDEENE